MTYAVNINIRNRFQGGDVKTELWAEITNQKTNESFNELIWWEDKNGVFHDCTPNLPVDLRRDVDTAWIEKKRKI